MSPPIGDEATVTDGKRGSRRRLVKRPWSVAGRALRPPVDVSAVGDSNHEHD